MAIVVAWIGDVFNLSVLRIPFFFVLILLAMRDLLPGSRPAQLFRWQIPSSWMTGNKLLDLPIWGAVLGAGVFTFSRSNLVAGVWLTILLSQNLQMAPVLGSIYGAARATTLVVYGFYLASRGSEDLQDRLMPLSIGTRWWAHGASATGNLLLAVCLVGWL